MIKGTEVAEQVKSLLGKGLTLEDVLYQVTQEQIKHLPEHLKDDPKELSTVLHGVQYYAQEAHPEFISGADVHDRVLLRLIPKKKD